MTTLLHVVADLAIGILILTLYRRVRDASHLCAAIMAAGLLLRATIGVGLFAIAWFDLPIARNLHQAGFWSVAIDARTYYHLSADAAVSGLSALPQVASEAYLTLLTIWLRVVGLSPAAGLFLNVVVYAITCWILVRSVATTAPGERVVAFALLTFSCSPAILIWGSQPLKDEIFADLVICAAAILIVLLPVLVRGITGWRQAVAASLNLAILFVCYFGISAIRSYYGIALLVTVAAALIIAIPVQPPRRMGAYAAGVAVLLVPLWYACAWGGGELYESNIAVLRSAAGLPPAAASGSVSKRSAVSVVADTRAGFANVQGGTTIRRRQRSSRTRGAEPAEVNAVDVGTGLASLFVPISVLKAVGVVELSGGRGLLAVADLDTLYVDATLLVLIVVLYRRRAFVRSNWQAALAFGLTGAGLAILAAAIVTNFGTLFRMRIMIVAPLWAMALTAVDSQHVDGASDLSTHDRRGALRTSGERGGRAATVDR